MIPLTFINQYCHKVFSKVLNNPIVLNKTELQACELGAYISDHAGKFEDWARFIEITAMLNTPTTANNSNAAIIATDNIRRDENQNTSISKDLHFNNENEYEYWFEDADNNGMIMNNNNNTTNNQNIIIFDGGMKKWKRRSNTNENNNNVDNDDELDVLVFGLV